MASVGRMAGAAAQARSVLRAVSTVAGWVRVGVASARYVAAVLEALYAAHARHAPALLAALEAASRPDVAPMAPDVAPSVPDVAPMAPDVAGIDPSAL